MKIHCSVRDRIAIRDNPNGPVNWETEVNTIVEGKRLNKEIYTWFYDHVLSHVSGRKNWKKFEWTLLGTKMATVSDEAMALLLLDNSWKRWKDKAEGKSKDEWEAPKYTLTEKGSNTTKKWSAKGMERYNELYEDIKVERDGEDAYAAVFDEEYREAKREERNGRVQERVAPNRREERMHVNDDL
jgi:hypothetical protein